MMSDWPMDEATYRERRLMTRMETAVYTMAFCAIFVSLSRWVDNWMGWDDPAPIEYDCSSSERV